MKLNEFARINQLSHREMVDKLNKWCGFDLWTSNSRINENQIDVFSKINWSTEQISTPELPSKIKGIHLLKLKIPLDYNKIPTRNSIIELVFDLNIHEYPKRQSISSRINTLITNKNPFIKSFQIDKRLINFSNSNSKNCYTWILNEILKLNDEDSRYDEKIIFNLYLAYCKTNNHLSPANFEYFNNLTDNLILPCEYKSNRYISLDEFIEVNITPKLENVCILKDLISYYYNINLNQSFFDLFRNILLKKNLVEEEPSTYYYYFIQIVEIIQSKNYVKSSLGKIFDPSKAASIYPLLVPMK